MAIDATWYTKLRRSTQTSEDSLRGPAATPEHTWQWLISGRLAASDFVVVTLAVFLTQIAWLGWGTTDLTATPWRQQIAGVPYYVATCGIILVWLTALSVGNTRDVKILGSDSTEYSRVASVSMHVFGIVAMVAYFGRIDLARGFMVMAFPIGTIALLVSRWLWRKWLISQWRQQRMRTNVFIVGTQESVTAIVDRLLVARPSPFNVVAVAAADPHQDLWGDSITVRGRSFPVVSLKTDVSSQMQRLGANTLVLAGGHMMPARRVSEISWSLQPNRQRLVVSSGVMGVGATRLAVRPVAGLPLVQVEPPAITRPQHLAKRSFDVIASGLGIILISPLLATIALIVKLSDGGPVFFKQERVGLGGTVFKMYKFRSMHVDAEQRLIELKKKYPADAGNSTLFKLKDDPRVTRVGKYLRRYSLDELPQLFNVLNGTMSLVGPRPPLMREVKTYDRHVYRKFIVKPGITGLWQVNGRSNLSWEDSVRFDLYYAENWTMMGDLQILFRTFKAVVGSDGAY
ncbi:sugar transferase [Changpingibacter yushuensis]|uniref:sugar transferase n=1 Tax=Changpingibacter yushuensis TaxID=2758440 RepID=UPI00165DC326|nr:sugar transferase [Changpingibacter yushuensis]